MINRLISDYLKITGRPAATLTVREYLEFAKVGTGDATSLGGTLSASEALIVPTPTEIQDTKDRSRTVPVEPKVEPKVTKTADHSEEKKAEKGASSNSVLSILKSISG